MQKRHSDENLYFQELAYTSEKYLLPFIESYRKISEKANILEIGCSVGGNLFPLIQRGCPVIGVDLDPTRIEQATRILKPENNPQIQIINADIFTQTHLKGKFDLIIVHDVVEHILDRDNFFKLMKSFLAPDGIIFLGFPAWQMPFGGHQQICKSKFLSHLPFFHLLPRCIYKAILKAFHESEGKINALLYIKQCGISIEECRKYLKRNNYKIEKELLYFINPHYKIKFGLKPRKLSPLIAKVPWIRNFFCTSCFLLIRDNK